MPPINRAGASDEVGLLAGVLFSLTSSALRGPDCERRPWTLCKPLTCLRVRYRLDAQARNWRSRWHRALTEFKTRIGDLEVAHTLVALRIAAMARRKLSLRVAAFVGLQCSSMNSVMRGV